ncbi:MAG: elongation factor P [Parcubacteria group bacterium]|nr:elongation factor P [Parcubacteria group bacterium]
MLSYNEITGKKTIILDGEPYEVLTSQTVKKQRQKPTNQTKLRNLLTGSVVEKAFHQSDKVYEAEIEKKDIKYLYESKGEFWFSDPINPKDRFSLPNTLVAEQSKYFKENGLVEALVFNENIIGVQIPIKVTLKVVEAPPSIKGNTASGGDKKVVIETGASVTTPLFINVGDEIIVNTETGEYVERAK